MNKLEFVKLFAERKIASTLGLNEEEITKIFDGIIDCLIAEIVSKGEVEMPQLGRLMVKVRPESFGENPLTGETLTIPAENVVIFRPDFGKIPFPVQETTDTIIQETGLTKITPELISDFFDLMLEVLQKEEAITWYGFACFTTYYEPVFDETDPETEKVVKRIKFSPGNQLTSLVNDAEINIK